MKVCVGGQAHAGMTEFGSCPQNFLSEKTLGQAQLLFNRKTLERPRNRC